MRTLDVSSWKGREVLLVAPHPDDEAIGAGGSAHLAARAGARVVPLICAGGAGGIGADGARAEDRQAESRRACALLGIAEPVFLGLTSEALRSDPARSAQQIAERLGTSVFDVVLAPSPLERHATHRACLIAAACSGAARPGAEWWAWGVWDAIPAWEDVAEVDVTAGRSAKTAAIAAHASQNSTRALAAGIAARDMAQAVFSRITGDEPRKSVERLLPLGDLPERLAAVGARDAETAEILATWFMERAQAWARSLGPDPAPPAGA